MTQKYVKDN